VKIGVIGAGPGGLYSALLLREALPSATITVFDQGPADRTYGWGVVFSGRALDFLAARSRPVYNELLTHLERWDELHIVHQKQTVAIDGSVFSAIARLTLLQVLQQHAKSVGVRLNYSTPITTLDELNEHDLVVVANGIGREQPDHLAEHLQRSRQLCSNRYAWYGTSQVFAALSLIFVTNDDGAFVAHTYRYNPSMSTFIVETDARTFARAGLGEMNDAQCRAYCESVFADALAGHALKSNNSNWLQFPVVACEQWVHQNTVVIGDACRSVHFSIGSGTRSAMEDAIALTDAVAAEPNNIPAALAQYETTRRRSAGRIDQLARQSLQWYESFASKMHLQPARLAMDYMQRGNRLDLTRLAKHAPRFVAAYKAELANAP
jgi:anthraniloyl-CoA monooxygenase